MRHFNTLYIGKLRQGDWPLRNKINEMLTGYLRKRRVYIRSTRIRKIWRSGCSHGQIWWSSLALSFTIKLKGMSQKGIESYIIKGSYQIKVVIQLKGWRPKDHWVDWLNINTYKILSLKENSIFKDGRNKVWTVIYTY